MIPTADIKPNEYNPNVVPERIMEQLKKSIERGGIEQPILVRKDGKQYIIIDGEHRWKAAVELNIEKLPCTVKDVDENEAKIETINMNKLRGEFDSLKLAEVLKSLQEVYSPAELEERLGYTEIELKTYEDLLNFDFNSLTQTEHEGMQKIQDEQEALLLNEFSIQCNLTQLELIEAAISIVGPDVEKSEALAQICTEFLEENAPEKIKEINDRRKQLRREPEVTEEDLKEASPA